MKRSLIIVTVIGLVIALSSLVFGQKTKKTNSNPNSQAGSEAATTNNTSQAATKEQSVKMKVRDKNSWYNTKVYVEIALSYLTNPANGFADDSNFHSLKQNTKDAHALLICYETGVNPCNNSGAAQNLRKGNIEAVKSNLTNAKSDLSRNAFSSSEKTAVMAKLNKALELVDVYINDHTYTAKSSKGKGVGADDLVKTNPQIDESTKTQNGQNPIGGDTSNSSSSDSTQKATKPNSGFMDYTDDAAKATPKSTKKQINNLSGDDDLEKTQKSAKKPTNGIAEFDPVFAETNAKSTQKKSAATTKKQTGKPGGANGIEMTPCDVQGTGQANKNIGNCAESNEKSTPKTNNLGGDDDPEKTQRSTKTNNPNAKTTGSPSVTPKKNAKKTTNFQTTSEDLQSVKKAKTQNGVNDPGDWSSEAKTKTTQKSSNTTSRKRKVNSIHEGNELKTPKKKP